MVKKVEKFVFYPKWLYGAKNGQILETVEILGTQERKSPILRTGLFKAFKRFSKSQLHTSKKLDARHGVIVIKLVFLAGHIVNQRKGRDLVVHLVIRAEAEV